MALIADFASSAAASARRRDPLFRKYPQDGEFRLQSGIVVKTPFHAYCANACILAGTADSSAARRLLRDSGLEPVLASDARAYAEIWIVDYRDTGLGSEADVASGAYTELAVVLFAASEATLVPWKNNFSPLKAASMSGSSRLPHQLVLPTDRPVPIDYGREILGLDKQPGSVRIVADDRQVSFEVKDSRAAAIVQGTVRTRRGFAARVCSALGVLRALGLLATVRLIFQATQPFDLATKDVTGTRRTVLRRGYLKRSALPELLPWEPTDELRFGAESTLGTVLSELSFRPSAILRIDGWKGVFGMRERDY